MFECSTDNERIVSIYGTYNFWSWLKYWLIDSANLTMMLLMDKTYYDYDYEPIKEEYHFESVFRTDEEVHTMLSHFGLWNKPEEKAPGEMSDEELQEYARKGVED